MRALRHETETLTQPLDDVTATLTPVAPFQASGDSDEFMCFTMDPELTSDVYIDGVEIVPGNPAVVHHVLAFIDYDGASAALADAGSISASLRSIRAAA